MSPISSTDWDFTRVKLKEEDKLMKEEEDMIPAFTIRIGGWDRYHMVKELGKKYCIMCNAELGNLDVDALDSWTRDIALRNGKKYQCPECKCVFSDTELEFADRQFAKIRIRNMLGG